MIDNGDKNFMIFNISEIDLIDFNEVLETSKETVRVSLNGLKAFVKWYGNIVPVSVNNLTTKDGPYTYSEILIVLTNNEWTEINEI